MRLLFVRHGESEANARPITQGQLDTPLSERGREQASLIAARLMDERIDCVYVSDLDRAVQTARIILQHHPQVSPVRSSLLRERSAGVFEGRPKEEFRREYEKFSFGKFRPAKGESFEDLQRRAVEFYRGLLDKHLGQTVLLVGHGGFFTSLLLYLMDRPIELESFRNTRPPNCALTVLEVDADKNYRIALLNCVKHLDA